MRQFHLNTLVEEYLGTHCGTEAVFTDHMELGDAEYDAEDEPDFWDLVSEQDFANPDLEDFNDLAIVVKLNNIQVRNFVKRFPQVSRLDTPPEMMKDSND